MTSTNIFEPRFAFALASLTLAGATSLVGCAADDVTTLDDETAVHSEAADGLRLGARGANVRVVYEHLRKYGYYENEELAAHYRDWTPAVAREPADPELFDDAIDEGVRLYQAQHGLPVTGIVDAETQRIMQMPRCGHPDYYESPSVVPTLDIEHAYTHFGGTWSSSALSYRFANYTADMSQANVRGAIEGALFAWRIATVFTFSEVSSGENLAFGFYTGSHLSCDAFDGLNGVLAHAYSPGSGLGGDAHFDDGESWSYGFLQTVALHELGHSLGLGHSAVSGATMYPTYSGVDTSLAADDVAGIWSRYAAYTTPSGCGWLTSGQGLGQEQSVWSCDGRFQLKFQSDGNLVLYKVGTGALWASGTYGSGADRAIMQEDGNLVVYKADGNPVWATGTYGASNFYSTLAVQNDGNVVIYRTGGAPAWASNTCCH